MPSEPKIDEPWWSQEAIDRTTRKRLLAMDEAFRASMTAAIKLGQEKEPNAGPE